VRCKGQYIAQVVIDYDFEVCEQVFFFDELREFVTEQTTYAIRHRLKDLIRKTGTVNVYKQHAELHQVEGKT
jgi:hypothetical protein